MSVLYLVPTPISENTISKVLTQHVISVIHSLTQFIVEDIRTARRFISQIKHPVPINQFQFRELNEHTQEKEIVNFLPFILNNDTGIISEAGLPCLADPGAKIVNLAHANGISVVPLIGPSSIFLALIASGLNGQSFSFVGYLPVKRAERQARLKKLERCSAIVKQTQIFIETPYRNMQLLDDILNYCRPETLLTIAADIMGSNEFILTQSIRKWKDKLPDLQKIPTVFLLQA